MFRSPVVRYSLLRTAIEAGWTENHGRQGKSDTAGLPHRLAAYLFKRRRGERAFGAHELGLAADPAGRIVSAEIKIGDSMISLSEESPEWRNFSPQSLGGTTMLITLNVEDADAVWDQAISLGAKIIFPLEDQPYGYRQGRIEDPFGHFWIISTRIA
ncbi:MAG TPA: VOC family protein [Pyrinomonadaceae bacterium]|nr:VOC family protein [Pyrinomonadaceae bacterium]